MTFDPLSGWDGVSNAIDLSLSKRTPLVIKSVVEPEARGIERILDKMHSSDIVTVRVVPPSNSDQRTSTLDPVYHKNPGDTTWLEPVPAADLLRSMGWPSPVGTNISIRGPAGGLGLNASELADTALYWRAEIDRRSAQPGESLRRQVYSAPEQAILSVVDDMETPFELGRIRNHSWTRRSVLSRVATTGFYYPAHIDCGPNLLYSLGGHRRVQLADLKALLGAFPDRASSVTKLREVEDVVRYFGKVDSNPSRSLFSSLTHTLSLFSPRCLH